MNTLIFDFDGTIADTTAVFLAIANEILAELHKPPLTENDFQHLRDLTIPQALRQLKISPRLIPQLAIKARQKLHTRMTQVKPCEGMIETLRELKQRGLVLGILSSNSQANVDYFIRSNGLDGVFDFVQTGATLFGKHRRLKQLLRKHHIDPEQAAYVGDEVRDIDAGKAIRLPVFAVSWGINSRDALVAHQPTCLADRAQQLVEFVAG